MGVSFFSSGSPDVLYSVCITSVKDSLAGLRFCSWVWPALEPASLFALLMSVHKALGTFTKSQ